MEAYIIGGVRTAVAKFQGALTNVDAIELGAIVIGELVKRTGIAPEEVSEVIMGNVIQAGLGQNPARQSSIRSGLHEYTPAFTVNKVCGSGLKSVALAGQAIAAGEAEMIIAGGMESMTNAPYVLKTARWGQRLGHGEITDTLVTDALWDNFYNCHMGMTAEYIAEKYHVTREEQDEFAHLSQQKAEKAIKDGKFKDEIIAVTVPRPKGDPLVFDTDEHPRFGTTVDALAKLRPAFKKDGTITAGNASGINDGAAALLVVSAEKLKRLNPKWAFRITASESAALDPAFMGLGPINACRALLQKAKLEVKDLDLVEVNEAFAAQSIQVYRDMGWDPEKLNVLGGAIALGHPVGASGSRILVTLIHEMLRRNGRLGLASLCIGGGQGIAMIVERTV